MTIKLISAIAASAAFIGGAAYAGEGMNAEQKFSEIDANADGAITQEEFVAFKTEDGQATEAEAVEAFDEAAGTDDELSKDELQIAWADWEKDKSDKSY